MIETKIIKDVYFEKEFINKLHKYTKNKDIKNFIKTFIDWMIENNLNMSSFWLYRPYYIENGEKKYIYIEKRICDGCDMCYDLTGLSDREFADFISEVQPIYKYKNFIIKLSYDTKWTYSGDGYWYDTNPQFLIYKEDKIEIII